MKSICITALCGVLAFAGTISAQEVQPRTITTTGDSVVYVTPDEVIINFGVETFDANLDRAKAANDARSRTLLKAIAGLGVESKHIQTDNMTIEISYQPNGPAAGIAGYVARKAFAVKLTNTGQFEQLVDAGLKNGANQLIGFDFKTTQLRQYRDQARKMAIHAAKEKAVALTADWIAAWASRAPLPSRAAAFRPGSAGITSGTQLPRTRCRRCLPPAMSRGKIYPSDRSPSARR